MSTQKKNKNYESSDIHEAYSFSRNLITIIKFKNKKIYISALSLEKYKANIRNFQWDL